LRLAGAVPEGRGRSRGGGGGGGMMGASSRTHKMFFIYMIRLLSLVEESVMLLNYDKTFIS
jgi:hypothetical protein